VVGVLVNNAEQAGPDVFLDGFAYALVDGQADLLRVHACSLAD